MIKTILYSTAASLFLVSLVSAVYADRMELPEDGTQVVAASKFMLAQSQKLKAMSNPDRAWLVDEGHQLIKRGYQYIEAGEFMNTDQGSINMQKIGKKLLECGQLLLKMGRQKGAVTPKENDEIAKLSKAMNDLGTLMLVNGKMMKGGND